MTDNTQWQQSPTAAAAQAWAWPGLAAAARDALSGLAIAAAFTPVVVAVRWALDVRDVHFIYIIPVLIAAGRFGLVSALTASIVGTMIAAFFFYEPYFSFRIINGHQVVGLAIFVVVSAITSQLAASSRASATAAAHGLRQLELLYAFSRRLAAATVPDEIFAAVQDHVSALIGARVSVVPTEAGRMLDAGLPDVVRRALAQSSGASDGEATRLVADAKSGMHWLLRPLPRSLRLEGGLLVELGRISPADLPALRREVEARLEDAAATLERLDLASTVAEAELRRQSGALREAIIGSASHSLRTPLASIMGSASILAGSPRISDDPRLAALAGIIVTEADHLNRDIQKMLDAATLSADAIQPQPGWIEPTDLINAAIETRRRELAHHEVAVEFADDLPLVHADGAQVRDALGLVLDNAARYSEPGTRIAIVARVDCDRVAISVADEGVGLAPDECTRVLDKFYRAETVRGSTRGSGLGLWISSAFMAASNGDVRIASAGHGRGTTVTLRLPAASDVEMRTLGGSDE